MLLLHPFAPGIIKWQDSLLSNGAGTRDAQKNITQTFTCPILISLWFETIIVLK